MNPVGRLLGLLPHRRAFRAALRILSIAVAAVLLWLFSYFMQVEQFGMAFIVTMLIIVVSVFEFLIADILVDSRFPRHSRELVARLQHRLSTTPLDQEILEALRACVASFQGCDVSRVSSTVHLKVDVVDLATDSDVLAYIQLSDYSRSGLGGRRWRVFAATKGVVGQCLRRESKVWANFRTAADYRLQMVSNFGYTAVEADGHTRLARSYLAYPVRSGPTVIGALFFHSTEPQVFPHAAGEDRLADCASRVVGVLRVAQVLQA